MNAEAPSHDRKVGSTQSWRTALVLLMRVGIVAFFLASGMGLLTFLKWTQRISTNHLVVDVPVVFQAIHVAAWCIPISAIAALQTECCLLLLGLGRWPYAVCQMLFPSVWALFGGILAFVFFHELESGPKETMLFAGGALLFFLGTALHLSLWRLSSPSDSEAVELPGAWYWILLVLATTFFGGFWGWRGDSPQARKLLEYRHQRPQEEQQLPPPRESPLQIVRESFKRHQPGPESA